MFDVLRTSNMMIGKTYQRTLNVVVLTEIPIQNKEIRKKLITKDLLNSEVIEFEHYILCFLALSDTIYSSTVQKNSFFELYRFPVQNFFCLYRPVQESCQNCLFGLFWSIFTPF